MKLSIWRRFLLVITVLWLVSCEKGLIVGDGSLFFAGRDIAIAPMSISAVGNSLVISNRDINFFSDKYGIRPRTIELIGLQEGSYTKEQFDKLILELTPRFEDEFEEFYHLVLVAPANYDATQSDRSKTDLVKDMFFIYDAIYGNSVKEYLHKYKDDLFSEESAKKFSYLEQSNIDPKEYDNFIFQVDLFRRYVQYVGRAKTRISAWVRDRKLDIDFSKKLRLTVDMASLNNEPLVTTRRAYAFIKKKASNKVKSRKSEELVFKEGRKECNKDKTSCRIEYISDIDDDSPAQLADLVDQFLESQRLALGLSGDPGNDKSQGGDSVREMLSNLDIHFTIVVNGRIAEFNLPGKYIELEEWSRAR